MPLPQLTDSGDLPLGIHRASLQETLARIPMINNDQELEATLQRIRQFQDQLTHLRKMETNPTNYRLSASGFIAEIDRMQLEVREYLSLPPSQLKSSA